MPSFKSNIPPVFLDAKCVSSHPAARLERPQTRYPAGGAGKGRAYIAAHRCLLLEGIQSIRNDKGPGLAKD